jgi:hypothetical protein
MIAAFFIAVTLATGVITYSGLKSGRPSGVDVFIIFASATAAFAAVFAVQMLVFVVAESVLFDAVAEELFKAGFAAALLRIANPYSVIAIFAWLELTLGKFLIPYLIDASLVLSAIETHGAYLALVTLAAYVMHISTAALYTGLGIAPGIFAATTVHVLYNVLAQRTDETATTASGIMLLGISTLAACATVALSSWWRRGTRPV